MRVLNLGTVAGLPTGFAASFLTNRLLPIDVAGRPDWEVRAFFAAWVPAACGLALRPPRRVWSAGLGTAAAAFAANPLTDALTVGEARVLGFDAAMLAPGLPLALAG